jgi:hypothetical protein
VIASADGGSSAPTIVDSGPSGTVELTRGSLWIAPDLWKTHHAFPTRSLENRTARGFPQIG